MKRLAGGVWDKFNAKRRPVVSRAAWEALEGRRLLSTTLLATADTDVLTSSADSSAANANFGADLSLRVSGASGAVEQAFVRFDISQLSGVGQAILRLHGGQSVAATTAAQVGIFTVRENETDWVEGNGSHGGVFDLDNTPAGEVRWNNQPRTSGGAVDSAHIGVTGDYLLDVTAAVRSAQSDGRQSISFALRNVGGESGEAAFASRESGAAGPTMVIEENTNGPRGAFNVPLVDTVGAAEEIRVTYTDSDDINAATIGLNDLEFTGPAGRTPRVTSFTVDASDARRLLATYIVEGPGGSWDISDNGTYSVFVRSGEVADLAGNAATGGPNEFFVDVPQTPAPPPADTIPPAAVITQPSNITTAGGTTQAIVVTVADDVAVRAASIRDADLIVTSASGSAPLTVTDVTLSPSADAASIVATFTVAAPGGSWDVADNGVYNVILLSGSISDVAGNVTGAAVGTSFSVNVPSGPSSPPPSNDPSAPSAKIDDDFENITTAGGTTQVIKVKFQDNKGIDLSSIDSADLIVSRAGSGQLAVTNLSLDPSDNGKRVEATYTLSAPGGTWDSSDNGRYDIQVRDGAVADTSGNRTSLAVATFTVNVPEAPSAPADTAGPSAVVAESAALAVSGGTEREVKVTYADASAILLSSVDPSDIIVARAGETPLQVLAASFTPPTGGKIVTATYVVAAPGGDWDFADNGTYTVTVNAGAVQDTNGNLSAAASGSFAVTIAAPPPTIDPGFGGGSVSSPFIAEAAAAQSDGKILVVGREGDLSGGTSRSVVQRLNADGSLDTTFAGGGRVVGPDGLNEAFYAITLMADGSILAAGTQHGDFVTAKFKSNGQLDAQFGEGGRATANFGSSDDAAFAIAVANDGTIVSAGGSNGSFAFVRYAADGTRDPFFGDRGLALFAYGSSPNLAAAVAIQPDGKILATGPSDSGVVVVRLNTDGSKDGTFGQTGSVLIPALSAAPTDVGTDRSIGIVLQKDGKVLVNNRTAGGDFAVARLNADGALDDTFGTNGVTTIDFGGNDDADAIFAQASGEIFAIGTTDVGGTAKAAVAAISSSGQLARNFGSGGKLTIEANITPASRELHVGDLVVRAFGSVGPDGRLVIGTSDQTARATTNSTLRRINVPGSGLLGQFGNVSGVRKPQKLIFTDADGTVVTITLKGGSGQAFFDGTNLDLVLTGTTAGALSIKTKGGDGAVLLRDVMVDGGLKSLSAKTTDLGGTFSSGGVLSAVTLRNISGTLASGGMIGKLTLSGNLSGNVFSGANFGSDGKRGGSGASADTFTAGRIAKISIRGSVTGATIAAGLDPVDDRLLDGDDRLIDPATSMIGAIAVKGGTDDATRFVAGQFGKTAKLPQKVRPIIDDDPRFLTL